MEQSSANAKTSTSQRMPVLDSELLKTFLAIADTGSFTRAAKAVFRTPSAVSMQIKRLEEALNSSMFVREGRSVSLTNEGEALLSYARRIMQLQEEAVARFICPTMEGTVRVGTPDDFAVRFLPNILSRFNRSHPKVDVEVHCGTSNDLVDRLETGQLDMTLITLGHGSSLKTDTTVVFGEPLVWVGLDCGEAHLRKPLPLALSVGDCLWRSMAMEAMDKVGLDYRIAYSSQHYAGQQAAIMADLAIAPLPLSLAISPFRVLGAKEGMPELGNYQIALLRARGAAGVMFDNLQEQILDSFYAVN